MSVRVALLFVVVVVLSIYAWRRDWFGALCGAIALWAFLERHDNPRMMFGIWGLNLWNVLFGNVVLAWLAQRRREGLEWDVPRALRIAFAAFCGVIVWAFLRAFITPTEFYPGGRPEILVEGLINSARFLLPCILLYDGCRTRRRVVMALGAILLFYCLLSLQVIKHMGLSPALRGGALTGHAAKVISKSTGYNRVDVAMMLAGASWAVLAASQLTKRRMIRIALWGASGIVLLGLADTGGRMGYITWGLVGIGLCLLKWRRLLPIIPITALFVGLLMPGVTERLLTGFGGQHGAVVSESDEGQITANRSAEWPYVIQKIEASPWIGYGRWAMLRTGLAKQLAEEIHDYFGHPHNAYLEILFDDGIIGFLCIMPIYLLVLTRSLSLFLDRDDPVYEAAGGVAVALLLALLIAAMGAQTFYLREGVVGMWAAIAVAMRVWVERERSRLSVEAPFSESLPLTKAA
jgi:O-antigen ligase